MTNVKPKYQMTDRRPIKRLYRVMGYRFVDTLVKKNVHSDTISYASVVFALIASAGLYFAHEYDWLLLVAPLFCFLRLYCNMIDGMVAVKSNKCSARGEVINELPDRISDAIIFLGLGLSGLVDMNIIFVLLFTTLFSSYIGVLSKAVGARRQFGGIMSKQYRMFGLALGCWAQFVCTKFFSWNYSLTLLDGINILIVVGIIQTIWVRTVAMFQELDAKSGH